MTETEQRCAQIEKEALATWACEKFSTYILGMKFMIETDHKPLVPLLGTKQLDNFPPRVLWFRLCLARFDYNINHCTRKLFYTADTLSHVPSLSDNNDTRLQDEAEMIMELCVTSPASTQTLSDYLKTQEEDKMCTSVSIYCQKGWPERKNKIATEISPYWNARSELTVDKNSLLLYQKRIVVPKSLQRNT